MLLCGALFAVTSGARVNGGAPYSATPPPFAGTAAPRLPATACPRVLPARTRNPFGTMVKPVTLAVYRLAGCWVGTLAGRTFVYDEYASRQYGGGLVVSYHGHVVAHISAGAGAAPIVVRFTGELACWAEQAGAYFFAVNLITGAEVPTRQASRTCAPRHWPPRYVLGLKGHHYPLGVELRQHA